MYFCYTNSCKYLLPHFAIKYVLPELISHS
nr:MAG TPA: hypothetical protein [Caudoviricetes sp.]